MKVLSKRGRSVAQALSNKKERVTVIKETLQKKIKRKIHRVRKGTTVYAEVRTNLYDAVEQRVEFKEVRWDSKGRCYIAETFPGDYRGILATIYPKAEGKSGSVVYFTLMMYSTKHPASKPFIKDIKPRLTVNKSDSGIQFLWFNNSKPAWKVKTPDDVYTYFGQDFAACTRILVPVYKELEKIYSPQDFIPILARMERSLVVDERYRHGPYDLDQPLLHRFVGGTNPRDLLNKLYGKKGQQGLSKNAFGGIGQIKSFATLVAASDIVRMAKSFPTSFFDKIKLLDYGSKPVFRTDSFEPQMTAAQAKHVQYFLKYFNHSKIQNDLLTAINRAATTTEFLLWERDHGGESGRKEPLYLFSQDAWQFCKDGGRMLETICKHATASRQRALWKNVKAFKGGIKETHDMITLEHARIQNPEKKLSYRKEQKIALHNCRVTDDIVSVLPDKNIDLVVWGSTQNNCIGSYAELVTGKGEYPNIIVGFMNTKTNNWVGHAQIVSRNDGNDKWDIVQLRGKNNDALSKEDDEAIRFWLVQSFVMVGDLTSVYEEE